VTERDGAANRPVGSRTAAIGAIDRPVHSIAGPGNHAADASGSNTFPAGSTNESADSINSATAFANATSGPITPVAESIATTLRCNNFVCRRRAAAADWRAATCRPINRPSRATTVPRGPSNGVIGARIIAADRDVVSCGSINVI